LQIDNLLVPSQSYVLDRGMSSRFRDLTRHIANRLGAASGCPRLFVSRRDAPKRRLVNEAEIEALFSTKGFRIFHPEEHTIEEQVRAFAGASLVAGSVGSGLYSVAFSPPTTRLIVLAPDEFYTRNDQILASARDHAPVFVFGCSEGRGRKDAMLADWYLDPAAARAGLEQVLSDAELGICSNQRPERQTPQQQNCHNSKADVCRMETGQRQL
jgi:capsular polysaccharide biosynthesis protein